MRFRDKLKETRDAKGMTQEGLAAASGLSVGTIRNLEYGNRLPTFPVLQLLTQALGESLSRWDGLEVEVTPKMNVKKAAGEKPAGRKKKPKS